MNYHRLDIVLSVITIHFVKSFKLIEVKQRRTSIQIYCLYRKEKTCGSNAVEINLETDVLVVRTPNSNFTLLWGQSKHYVVASENDM